MNHCIQEVHKYVSQANDAINGNGYLGGDHTYQTPISGVSVLFTQVVLTPWWMVAISGQNVHCDVTFQFLVDIA